MPLFSMSRLSLPTRLPVRHPVLSALAAIVIATVATATFAALRARGGEGNSIRRLDDLLYDAVYKLRPAEDRSGGEVVVLLADDKALAEMNAGAIGSADQPNEPLGWPWPRHVWGALVPYLQRCGARAVVFDLLFEDASLHNPRWGDDERLRDLVDAAGIPVIFGTQVTPDGRPGRFAPPVARPVFGAVNDDVGGTVRTYAPRVAGYPSLALRAAAAARGGSDPPGVPGEPFRLHFYGPTVRRDGRTTFTHLSVTRVIQSAVTYLTASNGQGDPTPASTPHGVDPALFRGKVVLVGASARGTYDVRDSPLDAFFPGVEAHATAIENLLHGQRVHPVGGATAASITFLAALLASLGIIYPRQTSLKLLTAVAVVGVLVAAAALLFRGATIRWLPLATPLLAVLAATVAAFAWSYLTEGRQRQLVFRALAQAVSPEMADELQRNSDRLKLGGERREMTVMFTDIAGFTDLSETMEVEQLTALMNVYLEQMSAVVLASRGYVDKYIGDAIMSFWNGPIPQPDHAARACATALAMQAKEREMQPDLARLGATALFTRIGVNTGPMALGNMGSTLKFAYTVLGDSVNLGSRLEGANKLYGSQILMAHETAERVRDRFVVRQLDVLRVKGKKQPMPVYELLAERPADPTTMTRVERYEAALRCYQQRDWDGAEAALAELTEVAPDDAPAAALAKRVHRLRLDPPPAEWDGVYVAKDK